MNVVIPLFLDWKRCFSSFCIEIMNIDPDDFGDQFADFFSRRTIMDFDSDNNILRMVESFEKFKEVFQNYPATLEGIILTYKEYKNIPFSSSLDYNLITRLNNFLQTWNNEHN